MNYSILNLTLAGVLGVLIATSLMAAPMSSFKPADTNGDGMISLEEFVAQGGHEQAFREGDANRDSRLSSEEYTQASFNNDRIKAGKYVDDAWITAKIKALLLKDEGVKGLAVNVETHQGAVQPSGWVNTPEQIIRAEKIALGVDGVKGVRNDLLVKR
jgi:hyperosmotically inducible protein